MFGFSVDSPILSKTDSQHLSLPFKNMITLLCCTCVQVHVTPTNIPIF